MSTYAIGDTHGCVNTLMTLLGKLKPMEGDKIVFLGDYIDRGLNSKRTIDLIRELQANPKFEVVALRGNHEDMCLAFYRGDEMPVKHPHLTWQEWRQLGGAFLMNGGRKTIESFYPEIKDAQLDYFTHQIPAEYLDWMDSLPYMHEDEYAYYAHAGFKPYVEPKDQDPYDLTWIRNDFLHHVYKWDKPVVHGHTPWGKVHIDERRINVDTGCVFNGQLSAISLPAKMVYSTKLHDGDNPELR